MVIVVLNLKLGMWHDSNYSLLKAFQMVQRKLNVDNFMVLKPFLKVFRTFQDSQL
jgi:hypothetical protein